MTTKAKIPALTGLRTIAAGLVFFYHWFFQYVDELPLWIGAPFKVGYVGVPIFFALSGFLITLRYLDDFGQKKITYRHYLYKRFIRIFPLYIAVVTLFVAAFGRPLNMIPDSWQGWLSIYTLTQALFPDWFFLGTLVGWTLTIELIFYLVAPVLLKLFYRKSIWQTLAICLAASVLMLGIGLSFSFFPPVANSILGAERDWLMHYTFFGHAPDFFVGMFFAYLFLAHRQDARLRRQASKLIWGSIILAYAAALLLAIRDLPLGAPENRVLGFLIALAGSVLVLATALDDDNRNPVTRFLGLRWMVYLGAISYALYLIQLTEPIQWLYWLGLGEYGGIENRIFQAVLIYLIATPIAALFYELIEKPTHRLLSRRKSVV
jgi:peptidoglycan/LPS O-acetylase OafA/YrhL